MARTTIFPTQEILYDFLYMDMVPAASIIPAPFALEPGQTYAVQWGENLFENLSVIDAGSVIPGALAIGNCSGFELPGNNEPFAIAYFADDTGGEIVVFFLDGSESQTITVYLEDAGGGGEEETTNPIVLKDRTGTDIEYEGVEGVRVFDKDGNAHVFVPPVETEEKTVELDFSGGAMEVTPTAGKLLSKVGIPVPGGLIPENIAKDVDIAGVVGTHEGGGGGMVPYIFTTVYLSATKWPYQSSPTSTTMSYTVSMPSNATVHGFAGLWKYTYSSSQTSTTKLSVTGYAAVSKPEIYNSGAYRYAKFTYTSDRKSGYGLDGISVAVNFSVPGVYQMPYGEGTMVYADETAKSWPNTSQTFGSALNVLKIDLSKTSLTSLPAYLFLYTSAKEICLPATTTSISATALSGFSGTLDLSLCTAVPTLAAGVLTAADTLKIRVPAALYDSWIAAANWSTYASYIVPV